MDPNISRISNKISIDISSNSNSSKINSSNRSSSYGSDSRPIGATELEEKKKLPKNVPIRGADRTATASYDASTQLQDANQQNPMMSKLPIENVINFSPEFGIAYIFFFLLQSQMLS